MSDDNCVFSPVQTDAEITVSVYTLVKYDGTSVDVPSYFYEKSATQYVLAELKCEQPTMAMERNIPESHTKPAGVLTKPKSTSKPSGDARQGKRKEKRDSCHVNDLDLNVGEKTELSEFMVRQFCRYLFEEKMCTSQGLPLPCSNQNLEFLLFYYDVFLYSKAITLRQKIFYLDLQKLLFFVYYAIFFLKAQNLFHMDDLIYSKVLNLISKSFDDSVFKEWLSYGVSKFIDGIECFLQFFQREHSFSW